MSDYLSHEILEIGLEQQILELNKVIVSLRTRIAELEQQLNAKEKMPVPTSIVKQIVEMEAIIRKQHSDLEYYKGFVPSQIIINRENKNKPSSRKGGIPK